MVPIYSMNTSAHEQKLKQKIDGRTALWIATVIKGDKNTAQKIIDAGADVDFEHKGKTMTMRLLDSVDARSLEILELLLENGANVHAKDRSGWSLLASACTFGNSAAAELLIRYGADLNAKMERFGWSPMISATTNGHKEVVQLLIKKNADLELKDDSGETALAKAIYREREDIAKLLIDSGAEVNSKDNEGDSILKNAVRWGVETMVQILINWGADINIKDSNGNTPSSWLQLFFKRKTWSNS